MPPGAYQFCDVSLPVPLDQPFTYSLPETLRHRVQPGCRILVPFGPRKLTGVILRCHDERPDVATREALRLLDSEPVLDSGICWPSDAGLPATTAPLWATCCDPCCRWPPKSVAARCGR